MVVRMQEELKHGYLLFRVYNPAMSSPSVVVS